MSNIIMGRRFPEEDLKEMADILSDMEDRYINAKFTMSILVSMGLAAVLMGILISTIVPSWACTLIGILWIGVGTELYTYHYARYRFVRNLHDYVLMMITLRRRKDETEEERNDGNDA